ncbi:septum site-determining protein MinC [Rhizobium sp. TRM95796]|uniref:septum site-determining protein MinC n=1 Tax=Rhizobium sp. TRM95796 TaxID=2979862 RepID=UPI0021E92C62|nr:septum site-determining protein MinC [Rhizobium sp. TRM95796]MCV3767668.1 septum site-determining protein MinC [Rhizobium sp. TRM95796]
MTKVLTDARSIRIKGRSFLAVVLSPDLPFEDWLGRLDDLASRSAGFFLGRPVVLDLSGLDIDRAQLKDFLEELAKRNVSVMGVEGARPSLIGPGMPPALKGGRASSDVDVSEVPATVTAAPQATEDQKADDEQPGVTPAQAPQPMIMESRPQLQSLMIREPVRSGQSVIFPEGDITVIGSVASGAEVIAGGSIHIYGALRGRALAGSLGNAAARIFCRKMEAELIAIDGVYKMADDMPETLRGHPVQLWLEDDAIMAEKIN